jgi:hypothetical protein
VEEVVAVEVVDCVGDELLMLLLLRDQRRLLPQQQRSHRRGRAEVAVDLVDPRQRRERAHR